MRLSKVPTKIVEKPSVSKPRITLQSKLRSEPAGKLPNETAKADIKVTEWLEKQKPVKDDEAETVIEKALKMCDEEMDVVEVVESTNGYGYSQNNLGLILAILN